MKPIEVWISPVNSEIDLTRWHTQDRDYLFLHCWEVGAWGDVHEGLTTFPFWLNKLMVF